MSAFMVSTWEARATSSRQIRASFVSSLLEVRERSLRAEDLRREEGPDDISG